MKNNFDLNTKYKIDFTSNFKKQYKKIVKQGKDITKFKIILDKLANNEQLDEKYRDHPLLNDKYYKDCRECHIEPDWLLIYQYQEEKLVLLLINIGSHSEIFKKNLLDFF